MKKEVTVLYEVNKVELPINVQYNIEQDKNVQIIHCKIDTKDMSGVRHLIQLRTFELRSLVMDDGTYAPVFTDNEYINNKVTGGFITKAYEYIMKQEGLKVEVL